MGEVRIDEGRIIDDEAAETIRRAWATATEKLATQRERAERQELAILHGDTPTFMEYPRAAKPEDLAGLDAAILGIPFEGITAVTPSVSAPPYYARPPKGSVYWRMGADEGLDNIRKYSLYYSIKHNGGAFWDIDRDMAFDDYIRVADYGDVPYTPEDIEGNIDRAEARVADIVAAGAVPIVFGGDHTIPTPILRAVLRPRKKKVGLIVFDSHMDLSNEPRNWASTEWVQTLELGKIDPDNFAIIGIGGVRNNAFERNVARELGHHVYTVDMIKDWGMKAVIEDALSHVTDGTDGVYCSIDIDCMEPSAVPSQKAPEIWGMTIDEMFCALRRLTQEDIIGADINEYTEDYDINGMGAQFCARVAVQFLAGIAQRKRAAGQRLGAE